MLAMLGIPAWLTFSSIIPLHTLAPGCLRVEGSQFLYRRLAVDSLNRWYKSHRCLLKARKKPKRFLARKKK